MLFSPRFAQGTSKTGAQFDIGLLGLKFTYFLKLTHIPKLNTLTWTLDYTKNSDFGKVEWSIKSFVINIFFIYISHWLLWKIFYLNHITQHLIACILNDFFLIFFMSFKWGILTNILKYTSFTLCLLYLSIRWQRRTLASYDSSF